MSIAKLTEISLADFPARAAAFTDEIIKFGLPGKELSTYPFEDLRPVPPDAADDALFDKDSSTGELTAFGLFEYKRACNSFDLALINYTKAQQDLLDYIVSCLSSSSKSLLETKIGANGYVAAKASYNTRRVWELIMETHMGSSMRIKQAALVHFMQYKQQPDQSFPDFLTHFRRDLTSVTTFFGASHPHVGYISIDLLARVLLINNVDPVYFSRQKDRAIEDFSDATSDELIALFQQHVVEVGTELTPAQFAGRGLAASIVSPTTSTSFTHRGANGPVGSLGPFDSLRASCSNCWDKGFIKTDHTLANCKYVKSKKTKAVDKSAKIKALAASTEIPAITSTALTVSTSPVTSPLVSEADSALAFTKRFETEGFAAYAKAMKTLGREVNIPFDAFFPCIVDNADLNLLDDVPNAFIGASSVSPHTYYDNAASVSLVKDLSLLSNTKLLDKPFRIGGLSSGALVTHVGELNFLPSHFRRCYFSSASSVNLVSLAYIQALGGSYWSIGTNQLAVAGLDGKPFDTVVMQPNRLYSPSDFKSSSSPLSCSAYNNWQSLDLSDDSSDDGADDDSSEDGDINVDEVGCSHPLSFPVPLLTSSHVTSEQRSRCQRVHLLHRTKAIHCSDDVLCEALTNGRFSEWNLTPTDVRLNRRLRGPCVSCLLAKKKTAPIYTSMTAPATSPGQVLHLDLKTRSAKSPGGKSISIRMSDEFSGKRDVGSSVSKEPKDLFQAITAMIDTIYTAHGHKNSQINADSDPSFLPLITAFAARQCKLVLMNPGSHETHIENLIGKDDARARAILTDLPYVLPQQYEIYLDRWVADNTNSLPNSRSRPSTADIIVSGCSRPSHSDNISISFGDVVIVHQHKIKRDALARRDLISSSKVNPGEIGVVLGYSKDINMDFDVLLANGQIVPRKYLDKITVTPFDWKSKRVYQADLSDPDPNPTLSSSEINDTSSSIPENFSQSTSDSVTYRPHLIKDQDGRVVFNSPSSRLPSVSPDVSNVIPPVTPRLDVTGHFNPPQSPVPFHLNSNDADPISISSSSPDTSRSSPILPSSPVSASVPTAPIPRRSARVPIATKRFALIAPSLYKDSSGRIAFSDGFQVVNRRNPGVTIQRSSYQSVDPIAKSCGDGLFTTREFRSNQRVAEYIGDRISVAESNRRRANGLGGYLLYLNKDTVLDCRTACAQGHCLASKANSALHLRSISTHSPATNNCDIRISNGHVYLVARHNIRSGTEILVPYGPRYLQRDFQSSPPSPASSKQVIDLTSSPVVSSIPLKTATPTSVRHVKFKPVSRHHVDSISYDDLDSLCLASALSDAIAVEEALCPIYLDTDEICLDTALALCAHTEPIALAAPHSSILHPSQLIPIPSTKCKEIRLKEAESSWDREKITRTTKVEIDKQIRIKCLSEASFDRSALPSACAIVPGVIIYKDKRDGRATARLAANGPRSLTRIPATAPGTCTFAGVASNSDKAFCMAMMQAHCEARNEKLTITDFDVVGGFLHVKRTSKIRLFLLLPKNLPHPDAGKYKEVFGCVYGLQESNNLFNAAIDETALSAGFEKCLTSPHVYISTNPADPAEKCIAAVIVDDFQVFDNMIDTPYTIRLKNALIQRFSEITFNSPSTSFAGIEYRQLPNGAIATCQTGYINRVASIIGVSHLPPITNISDKTFFMNSITPADILPTDLSAYTTLTGHLVHALLTRDDVKHFVSHVCSKNSCADIGDHQKAILLLRFLHSTSAIGRVFKASTTQIVAFSDASFANHENGRSAGAFFLSVGSSNAPFVSSAKMIDTVASSPTVAEYTTSNLCCHEIMHYRQFSSELGWEQAPTKFFMDSQTSINLVVAPEISKKSRFLAVKHHFIRERVADGDILPIKVPSSAQRADAITKIFPANKMISNYHNLLNLHVLID